MIIKKDLELDDRDSMNFYEDLLKRGVYSKKVLEKGEALSLTF